jgi:hypothetical protein
MPKATSTNATSAAVAGALDGLKSPSKASMGRICMLRGWSHFLVQGDD